MNKNFYRICIQLLFEGNQEDEGEFTIRTTAFSRKARLLLGLKNISTSQSLYTDVVSHAFASVCLLSSGAIEFTLAFTSDYQAKDVYYSITYLHNELTDYVSKDGEEVVWNWK